MPPLIMDPAASWAASFVLSQGITSPDASFTPATSVRKIKVFAWHAAAHDAAISSAFTLLDLPSAPNAIADRTRIPPYRPSPRIQEGSAQPIPPTNPISRP